MSSAKSNPYFVTGSSVNILQGNSESVNTNYLLATVKPTLSSALSDTTGGKTPTNITKVIKSEVSNTGEGKVTEVVVPA